MAISSAKYSVFFLLPQGKPNPKIARPAIGKDTRELVVQNPPKGPTCWFNALKILREQYGQKAPPVFLKERLLEKLISQYRKMLTTAREESMLEEEFSLAHRANPLFMKIFQVTSPEIALVHSKVSGKNNYSHVKLAELMQEFTLQLKFTDLSEYVQHRKTSRLIAIHSQYLRIFKVDPDEAFEKERKLRPWHQRAFRELSDEYKATFLSTLVIRTIAKDNYHMSESRWTPFQKIDGLIQELTERGPMFIHGLFGRTFYHVPPQPKENKLHGKTIWYWPIGSALPSSGASPSHSIVLIGASDEGSRGGVVYFVDPADGSDPNDPERQKVYAMSYQRLIEKIHDLFGEKFSDYHHTPNIPFALHSALRFTPAEDEAS